MSVGILLITHGALGSELLRIANGIFGTCPARADALVGLPGPRGTAADGRLAWL